MSVGGFLAVGLENENLLLRYEVAKYKKLVRILKREAKNKDCVKKLLDYVKEYDL